MYMPVKKTKGYRSTFYYEGKQYGVRGNNQKEAGQKAA